jgi:hypothetical protein
VAIFLSSGSASIVVHSPSNDNRSMVQALSGSPRRLLHCYSSYSVPGAAGTNASYDGNVWVGRIHPSYSRDVWSSTSGLSYDAPSAEVTPRERKRKRNPESEPSTDTDRTVLKDKSCKISVVVDFREEQAQLNFS